MRSVGFYARFSGEIFAAAGIVIAVVYLYLSFSIKVPLVVDFLGPRFMPLTLGLIFLAFSIHLLVSEIRRKAASAKPVVPMTFRTVYSVAGSAGLSVFYFLVIEHIGYLLTSLVFVFVFLVLSRYGGIVKCAIYAVGIVAIFQLIFRLWLGVPLPTIFV